MAETLIDVPNFSMMLEGERFDASMTLRNLDDYTWDVKAKGGVDLEKMTKIFPLEGMTVAGKVKANIETKERCRTSTHSATIGFHHRFRFDDGIQVYDERHARR